MQDASAVGFHVIEDLEAVEELSLGTGFAVGLILGV